MARRDDDEDDLPLPELTRSRLERLARLIRQQGHAHSLNPVQWEVLRYLARANALSNTPGAAARYLGSTKGTVSQTILALERKGLLTKAQRQQDKRSVHLALTEQGRAALAQDGLDPLLADIAALSAKTRKRLDRGLAALLRAEAQRQQEPAFGTCPTCRYFREAASGSAPLCMKVNAALSPAEVGLICIEFLER